MIFLLIYFPNSPQEKFVSLNFSLHPLLTLIPHSHSSLYFITLSLLNSFLSFKCHCHGRHFASILQKGFASQYVLRCVDMYMSE